MQGAVQQRVKALLAAKQREKERLTRPIHLERVSLSLKKLEANQELESRALLNDLSPKGVGVFTREALPTHTLLEVDLQILDPVQGTTHHFKMRGRVAWCQYQPSHSKVLSETPFAYRVGLEFTFSDDEVKNRYETWCEAISQKYAAPWSASRAA
jgi:hypothetical protein